MCCIEKKIKLEGSKGEVEKNALFDGGSTYSCIRPDIAKKIEVITPLPKPMEFDTAKNGEKVIANESIRINFYINGLRLSDEFMIIDNLSEDVIIGAKTMQAWRMKLDYDKEEVIIDPKVTKLRILNSKIR